MMHLREQQQIAGAVFSYKRNSCFILRVSPKNRKDNPSDRRIALLTLRLNLCQSINTYALINNKRNCQLASNTNILYCVV